MLIMNKTRLRLFRPSDRDFLVAVRHDLLVEAASQPTPPFPIDPAEIERRLAENSPAPSSGGEHDLELAITHADDPEGEPLGVGGLYEIDPFNGNAEIGAVIAKPSSRGLGLGIDTYVALAQYGLMMLHLHKVYAQVKSSNGPALATCARLGLTADGILPAHRWCNGEYVDLHLFSLLARDWNQRLVDWRDHHTD